MISASKTTFSHCNLKILRPKVTKNIKNLCKKVCEFRSCNPLQLFIKLFSRFGIECVTLLPYPANDPQQKIVPEKQEKVFAQTF